MDATHPLTSSLGEICEAVPCSKVQARDGAGRRKGHQELQEEQWESRTGTSRSF